MTHWGLKCVTLVEVCHLTDKKMSQMTQFYILTHFDVFCIEPRQFHFNVLKLIWNWYSNWYTSYTISNINSSNVFCRLGLEKAQKEDIERKKINLCLFLKTNWYKVTVVQRMKSPLALSQNGEPLHLSCIRDNT